MSIPSIQATIHTVDLGSEKSRSNKISVLCVCRWPLGGIRTYLKYNYHYIPRDRISITVLAPPSRETEHLIEDMAAEGIEVVLAEPFWGKRVALFWRILQMAYRRKYEIIHSQGYISAINVAAVNWLLRKRHIMTTHGVLEPKYFGGPLAPLKKFIMGRFLSDIDIIIGVGDDIVRHLREVFPKLERGKTRFRVIPHGIRTDLFDAGPEKPSDTENSREAVRARLGIPEEKFVFGYFGRFMPEKGFGEIIEAASILAIQKNLGHNFFVICMGGGDYEREYKKSIEDHNIDRNFIFIPFDSNISPELNACDTVLMPSWWEAYGLLALETLSAGVPLIVSDCSGLREAVSETPAIKVPVKDPQALAEAMAGFMENKNLKSIFRDFQAQAVKRFDVKEKSLELARLFLS